MMAIVLTGLPTLHVTKVNSWEKLVSVLAVHYQLYTASKEHSRDFNASISSLLNSSFIPLHHAKSLNSAIKTSQTAENDIWSSKG